MSVRTIPVRPRAGRRTLWAALLACALLLVAVPAGRAAVGALDSDFRIVVSPSEQTLPPGGTTVFLVEVEPIDGFDQPVSLSVEPLPSGLTATFAPTTVTPGTASFMTVRANASVPVGTTPITVVGTSGDLVRTSAASARVRLRAHPALLRGPHGHGARPPRRTDRRRDRRGGQPQHGHRRGRSLPPHRPRARQQQRGDQRAGRRLEEPAGGEPHRRPLDGQRHCRAGVRPRAGARPDPRPGPVGDPARFRARG